MLSPYPISASFPLTQMKNMEGRTLVCLRRIGAMDVARLEISAIPKEIDSIIAAGSPMHITWAANHKQDDFYGYVHSFRPISDGYRQRTQILGISAAYPMFNETGRSYTRVGIHNVAEEIALDHMFGAEVDKHLLVQDQILQGSASDWQFLQRLANQWGYVLLFDGVTIIFRSLLNLLEEKIRTAENEKTNVAFSPNGSNFAEFKPSFTAVGEQPVATTQAEGTRYTGTAIPRQPTREGVFQQIVTDRAISTDLESESVALANEVKQRFPFTAKAKVLFPIGKKPFDVYRIEHEGNRMTWTIQQVKHIVTGDNYIGEMILGSDGSDATNVAKGLDIPMLMRQSSRTSRARPRIRSKTPYFVGTGGNVLVKDQRWRADLLRVEER